MKRQIFRKLQDYSPKIKLENKKVLIHGSDQNHEDFTLYGTIEERTGSSITLGNFVDVYMPIDFATRIRTLEERRDYENMDRAIRFLEELHKVRTLGNPKKFNLSERLDCYVIDFS